VPGWHKQTKKIVDEGKLSIAGIVQEQHPDRAVLYMQWQQMNWPVLSDPFNDLGILVVPITLLIDEHGIIRYRNPKQNELEKFLVTEYSDDAKKQDVELLPKNISKLKKLVSNKKTMGEVHFRLGVAYRMRFDSEKAEASDFENAVIHWRKALELNPNQYIWRRRIQQYGPRLDKPYSFYDWIAQARKDISKRGEIPSSLVAEPSGAEYAIPERSRKKFKIRKDSKLKHPDPENKVLQDTEGLISNRVVIVSSTNKKQSVVRVHLTLEPVEGTTWTNDAGNVSFHINPELGVAIKDIKIPELPKLASSKETRVIEFELHNTGNKKRPKKIKGSVFYYVCTKIDNTCQYLRQDIDIVIE